MTSELKTLMRVTLPSRVGGRDVALHMPTMKDLNGLIPGDAAQDAAWLARLLPLVFESFVSRLDGSALTGPMSVAVAEDPELARALLVQIRTLLDTLRERGRVFALCPHCGRWEADVGMNGYALTIAEPLPSTFEGPFFATPSLASNLVAGARPPLPRAARIRVEVPSLQLGIPSPVRMAVLHEIDQHPDQVEQIDIDDDPYDDAYEGPVDIPIRHGAVWTALARLGRALEPSLPDHELEALPAVDFFFLDLVHYLVDRAPVRPDTAGRIRCARCEQQFIPVRRDFRAQG